MWEKAIRNSLETNEKTKLIKEIEVIFKKTVKIIELKDRITELNTY